MQYCQNCGKPCEDNTNFCMNCGARFQNDNFDEKPIVQSYDFLQKQQQNIVNNNYISKEITEEDLVKIYVGEERYGKINRKNSFNLPSAFFGVFWFVYNRAYLGGLALFGALLITRLLGFSSEVNSIISFLVYGYLTNRIYLWNIRKKIDKLKIKNNYLTNEQMTQLIKRKNKKNIIGTIILGIFLLVYAVIYASVLVATM